jgi:hypothetical protein
LVIVSRAFSSAWQEKWEGAGSSTQMEVFCPRVLLTLFSLLCFLGFDLLHLFRHKIV